jgi:predicted ATP-dependent serine protease
MAAQDVHGNTALHYLAGQRIVNKRLVDMLLEDELGSGKRVWETVRNRWGWTAKELWEDGIAAVEEPHKAFWKEAEEEVSRHTVEDVAGEG